MQMRILCSPTLVVSRRALASPSPTQSANKSTRNPTPLRRYVSSEAGSQLWVTSGHAEHVAAATGSPQKADPLAAGRDFGLGPLSEVGRGQHGGPNVAGLA